MRWASSLMTIRSGPTEMPREARKSISFNSTAGSTTMPFPSRQTLFCRMPEGTRWLIVFSPLITRVWPALAPP